MQLQEIVIPRKIGDEFVRLHSDWIFLYGGDLFEHGTFGQSWHLMKEPNCVRIPTMLKYCSNPKYWQSFEEGKPHMDRVFDSIPKDKIVIPLPKIGQGGARLDEMCPKLFEYMQSRIKAIAYPNIRIDYNRAWML